MLAARFMHFSGTLPIGAMIGILGTGPVGALLALALAIKLTEAKDGSRALVTAVASVAFALLLR
jgi:predicted dinucleotide-binding enzyme